jgi:hypothetical protein
VRGHWNRVVGSWPAGSELIDDKAELQRSAARLLD